MPSINHQNLIDNEIYKEIDNYLSINSNKKNEDIIGDMYDIMHKVVNIYVSTKSIEENKDIIEDLYEVLRDYEELNGDIDFTDKADFYVIEKHYYNMVGKYKYC